MKDINERVLAFKRALLAFKIRKIRREIALVADGGTGGSSLSFDSIVADISEKRIDLVESFKKG